MYAHVYVHIAVGRDGRANQRSYVASVCGRGRLRARIWERFGLNWAGQAGRLGWGGRTQLTLALGGPPTDASCSRRGAHCAVIPFG
eukprot:8245680-Pyramimonas_sp.AAC.1